MAYHNIKNAEHCSPGIVSIAMPTNDIMLCITPGFSPRYQARHSKCIFLIIFIIIYFIEYHTQWYTFL